jgi:hypothetical protein
MTGCIARNVYFDMQFYNKLDKYYEELRCKNAMEALKMAYESGVITEMEYKTRVRDAYERYFGHE